MIDRLIGKLPEAWRGPAELVAAPIAWVPVLQQTLMSFFFDPQPGWMAALKYVFLLFPVLLGVVAVWCTGLSVYTMPFRSARSRFVSLVARDVLGGDRVAGHDPLGLPDEHRASGVDRGPIAERRPDPLVDRLAKLEFTDKALHIDRAIYRIAGAIEHGQEAITSVLHDLATVHGN